MKFFLMYISVFIALYHNFAYSSPIQIDRNNPTVSEINLAADSSKITTSPSSDLTSSLPTMASKINKNISPQPQGRNMQFEDSPEDVLVLTTLQDNYDVSPDQPIVLGVEPEVLPFESHPLNFDDSVVTGPISQNVQIITQPINSLENLPAINNPSDDSDDEDMETAQQIVFRPLFAYRRQTAQKRRIYSKPSSTSNGNGQRRQESYPYRYPSYGYPYYYPSYYNKWC